MGHQLAPSEHVTQEEVTLAEQAEQAALTASQNAYLRQRVVALRAQLINAEKRVHDLEQQLRNEDLKVDPSND